MVLIPKVFFNQVGKVHTKKNLELWYIDIMAVNLGFMKFEVLLKRENGNFEIVRIDMLIYYVLFVLV